MTAAAHRDWARLARTGAVIPVTTRSTGQYRRIRLPGPPARHALVCNGARLLVDGAVDAAWEREARCRDGDGTPFDAMWAQARRWERVESWAVDGFFLRLRLSRSEPLVDDFAARTGAWAEGHGWRVLGRGRRFYVLPVGLDKARAVARLAERLGVGRVFAGGDSQLDETLLRTADRAIRPAHGDLHAMGFTSPRCDVTRSSGVAAGEEIVRWYLSQLEVDPHTR